MSESFSEQIRHFYENHRRELFVYALSLTGEQGAAEDAVHTAFAKILRRGRLPRDLKPYIFRCVRNAAIDEHRANGRSKHETRLFKPPEYATHSSNGDARFDIEEIFKQLTEDERETILLKVYSGMTLKEVAHARGARPGTVASWYRRGIEKLRAQIEENER